MHRLLLPLCVIGILIGAGTASGLTGTLGQLKEQLDAVSSFATESQPSTLLEEHDEEENVVGPLFLDVDPTAWYKPYVSAAAGMNIASGYKNEDGTPSGFFGPADKVSVAQMLKMAARAAGIDENLCIEPSERIDADPAHEPFYAAAERHWSNAFVGCAIMRQARIISRYPDLDRPAKRGEMIGIIHDLFGIDAPKLTAIYADTTGHAYESDIAYATVKKIVSGDFGSESSAPTFRPDDELNRAEASKIIIQSMEAYGRRVMKSSEASSL